MLGDYPVKKIKISYKKSNHGGYVAYFPQKMFDYLELGHIVSGELDVNVYADRCEFDFNVDKHVFKNPVDGKLMSAAEVRKLPRAD